MTNTHARTGAEILADMQEAPPREGVAHICMRPDLIDAWDKANDELTAARAEETASPRLGAVATKRVKDAAKKVRAIEEQIDAADVAFRFHKIGKTRHSEICEENPPRQGNNYDLMVGYNREAVDNAVAFEALVEPVFTRCTRKGCTHEDCGSWEQLIKMLGPGEWEEIARVVREVHEAVTNTPKSVLASRILDRPASGSGRRARGE